MTYSRKVVKKRGASDPVTSLAQKAKKKVCRKDHTATVLKKEPEWGKLRLLPESSFITNSRARGVPVLCEVVDQRRPVQPHSFRPDLLLFRYRRWRWRWRWRWWWRWRWLLYRYRRRLGKVLPGNVCAEVVLHQAPLASGCQPLALYRRWRWRWRWWWLLFRYSRWWWRWR